MQAAVDAAEAAQGPVDVLVCNAGAAQPGGVTYSIRCYWPSSLG